jgi:CubicO group peptidase (beta-lactamase class C family)
MYTVGANIVSTLTGMRFADFVDLRIFRPLGMTSSTYSIDAALQTGRFTDSWTWFGRLIPPWIEENFVDLVAGPVGAISSVEDLARHGYLGALILRLTSLAGLLAQSDSEWRCRPQYQCNDHPTLRV